MLLKLELRSIVRLSVVWQDAILSPVIPDQLCAILKFENTIAIPVSASNLACRMLPYICTHFRRLPYLFLTFLLLFLMRGKHTTTSLITTNRISFLAYKALEHAFPNVLCQVD